MSFLKNAIFVLLTLFALLYPKSIYAVTVRSYLVTEAKEFNGDPFLNRVYYNKTINFAYKSGRVVLSHNPDGTGEGYVGEVIGASQSFIGAFERNMNGVNEKGVNDCTPQKMKPLDITAVVKKSENNNVLVRFKFDCNASYQKIEDLYLVHFDDYDPNVTPFLDLPWDYKADGKAFQDVVLQIGSYFDHTFPLLSTNLFEPQEYESQLTTYKNESSLDKRYSKHDGYDYGNLAFVANNDNVLAAAAGQATYVNTCTACGNTIYIYHGNGYQTRYYHLQPEGLITNVPGQKIVVNDRQPIGRVGFSGNVDPRGEGGAHIHFMVVFDKNGDGNFDDNIPDGIVDPYGWQSDNPDPWENYMFSLNGQEKNGAKSHYLWKYGLSTVNTVIHPDGSSIINNRYNLTFPKNFVTRDVFLKFNTVPVSESSAELQPIGAGVDITLWDGIDTFFTNFQNFFTIDFSFTNLDITRFKPNSFSIYSSADGTNWQAESTTIDLLKQKATAQVNHLTQFAFMGQKIDSVAPVTTAIISGTTTNNPSEYTNETPVIININTTDQPTIGTLGIDYTIFKVNDEDWKQYNSPLYFNEIGEYEIFYYSVDKDGNIEDVKESKFSIVNPIELEAEITFDFENSRFLINAKDQTVPISTEIIKINKKEFDQTTLSTSSDKLKLVTKTDIKKNNYDLAIKSLQYNNDTPVEMNKNTFKIIIEANKLTQILNISKQVKVRLIYNKRKDKTTIVIIENSIRQKEEINGFKKLSFFTSTGAINYRIN
ncbi:MAG: hypothetical protein COU81_01175 [Candidatus Portnoybacteria bacterium CG10_big_fil_rev_8_21_14_0_10_36_7]|uniref:M23ase beta-sheet core domain-containing protein n=1 Tax=Candidatus Portnoybacteria bacterium CG10_big_fil_rev_8_21_14_0_10_36_7 TaxID=1974812 RepID=A0A2M8KEK9_9BACT|nr:MAG: hypothetical protein COU81_01175 [Candidatus Portnoybacteria bacterium CG10_big_fil_rev_8_21_14_0_10_36_7]